MQLFTTKTNEIRGLSVRTWIAPHLPHI
jgi:hypothetical protein